MKIEAYAKINLTLEVLGRRDDGFHDIATVLQTVSLADELTFEPDEALLVEGDMQGIPKEENLVLRAAEALRGAYGASGGAKITLTKRIPIAAGLGGGSADAGAALAGLSRLWGLAPSRDDLLPLAAGLGSDVPFFLYGGTALAEGRGEIVTPLPAMDEAWFVLATPPIDLPRKTATLFGSLGPEDFTKGQATRDLAGALEAGKAVKPSAYHNTFDEVADHAFPGLSEYRRRFKEAGAAPVHLSGAGPTLFAPVGDPSEGAALRDRCAGLGFRVSLVKTVPAPYNIL